MRKQSKNNNSFYNLWTENKGEIISSHCQEIKNHQNSLLNTANKKQLKNNNQTITIRTTQIRGVRQGEGDSSCGYYGIFFMSKLTQIFNELHSLQNTKNTKNTNSNASKKAHIFEQMQQLRSAKSFAKFKTEIMSLLLDECTRKKSDNYPWLPKHVNSGVLERAYLQHLQNNIFPKPALKMPHNDDDNSKDSKKNNNRNGYPKRYNDCIASKYGFRYLYDSINLMEFSGSSLKTNHLPLRTIDHLEFFFNEKFMKNEEHFKTFLIGSAIHYVVCALYRNYDNNEIEIIYIDPQNNDVLYKNSEYLQEKVIAPMKFKSWLVYGWKIETMRELAMDSIKGIQFAIEDLLTNTIVNIYSENYKAYYIRDRMIKMNISKGFIAGFNSHCLLPMVRSLSSSTNVSPKEEKKSNNDNDDGCDALKMDDSDCGDMFDENSWTKDCEYVIESVRSKLDKIKNYNDKKKYLSENKKEIESDIADIQNWSAFVKLWVSSYYPSAVIDTNIVNVVNKLENDTYIPHLIMQLLNLWSSLVMLFANANNRRLCKIQDDKFWKRLASTLLVVQIVSQTNPALTKL